MTLIIVLLVALTSSDRWILSCIQQDPRPYSEAYAYCVAQYHLQHPTEP